MTRICNDPSEFADEALTGFAEAHRATARRVHGGVIRATRANKAQVAVITGGGSGHYPAFAGWLGPGIAHGVACGNVFASPAVAAALDDEAFPSLDGIFAAAVREALGQLGGAVPGDRP